MENNKATKNNKKISSSGMRTMEILKALSKGAMSTHELFRLIGEDYIISRKEVLWKCINTLKQYGFDITKDKDKYFLNNVLETTDYTEEDLSVLKFIQGYTKHTDMKTIEGEINKIIPLVEKTFSDKTKEIIASKEIKPYTLKVSQKQENSNIKRFEKYCQDKLKVNIKYKISSEDEKSFKIAPIKIIYKKHKAVLIAYDVQNNEPKEFLTNCITFDEQTPQKISNNYPSTVIYKLKGRLARSYVLKDGDKVMEQGRSYLVVSNSKEDKEQLLRRLIRYYNKCEVVYPKDVRKQMINLIEDIEKIYARK